MNGYLVALIAILGACIYAKFGTGPVLADFTASGLMVALGVAGFVAAVLLFLIASRLDERSIAFRGCTIIGFGSLGTGILLMVTALSVQMAHQFLTIISAA